MNRSGLVTGVNTLPRDDANNDYVYPVAQFAHTGGIGATFTGQAPGGGFVVENGSSPSGKYFFIDFPKTGEIFYSEVEALRAADTQGAPESLSVVRTFTTAIACDHDNNPATPAVNTSMNDIITLSEGYGNTDNRVDLRYGQGPKGELYLFSKRNNMVYLISNSLPSTAD